MILSPNCSSKWIVLIFSAVIWICACTAPSTPLFERAHGPSLDGNLPLVAVLPVQNLSKTPAPLKDIRQALIEGLYKAGVHTVEDASLDRFMAKTRLRYMGGMTRSTAQALRAETGAGAVLLTTIELYSSVNPPKIALTARLVSTGDDLPILWMDSVGLAGDDTVGFLELSLIRDPLALTSKAVGQLALSLNAYLTGRKPTEIKKKNGRKFLPQYFYSSPVISPEMIYRVAVVPFFNISARPYAGDLMALHFVRHLRAFVNFDVIEPGEVRQTLLNYRIVMDDGISFAHVEILFSKLGADLLLSGKVLDYEDYQGAFGKPQVDFSAQIYDQNSREIVWTSRSFNAGDERVVFFNLGKINTAHSLASMMVQQAVFLIGK